MERKLAGQYIYGQQPGLAIEQLENIPRENLNQYIKEVNIARSLAKSWEDPGWAETRARLAEEKQGDFVGARELTDPLKALEEKWSRHLGSTALLRLAA